MPANNPSAQTRAFGRHVRSLRRARGFTQARLAEHCELSVDSVRRLEAGSFSPSFRTLLKIAAGLKVSLGSLFVAHELREEISPEIAVVVELIRGRPPGEIDMAMRLARVLFAELDGRKHKT